MRTALHDPRRTLWVLVASGTTICSLALAGQADAAPHLRETAVHDSIVLTLLADQRSDVTGEFGVSVSPAGDFNGDGYPDFIVGESQNYPVGRAHIFFGGPGSALTRGVILEGHRDEVSGEFGNSVSTAGDVNRDGYSDVIVGAYQAGAVYLFLGRPLDPDPDDPLELRAINANLSLRQDCRTRFGRSVGALGDINRDGYDDFIVGAHTPSNAVAVCNPAVIEPGRAFVYLGAATPDAVTEALVLLGDQPSDEYGVAVASADVNSDGTPDILVGAKHRNGTSVTRAGRVYVYFGPRDATATAPDTLRAPDADMILTNHDASAREQFGASVATAGDYDGDGFADDFIVGAPCPGCPLGGQAHVFLGGPGMPDTLTIADAAATLHAGLPYSATEDQFGAAVSGAGDLDGDGRSDVFVGAPNIDNEVGRSFLFLADGRRVRSDPDAVVAPRDLVGNASFGAAVGLAGDLDGNGSLDLLVGASDEDSELGHVYVFSVIPDVQPESEVVRFPYPTITVGDSTSITVAFTNAGGDTLTVNRVVIEPPSGDLEISPEPAPGTPLHVPPFASTSLTLRYRPTNRGAIRELIVESNDPVQPILRFPLHATALPLDFALVRPAEARQDRDLDVSLVMQDSTHSTSAMLRYRNLGESARRMLEMQRVADPLNVNDQWFATIPAESLGARGFEFRSVVFNGAIADSGDLQKLRYRARNLSFPFVPSAGKYRMVSVPLEFDPGATIVGSLSDNLGLPDPTVWRMFQYLPGSTSADSAYLELGQGGFDHFEHGRSFWLITRDAVRLDTGPEQGLTVPADSFTVRLDPGFNMIGNPFNFDVAWASVVKPDSVGEPVAWDPALGPSEGVGAYVTDPPAVLRPFEGYFVENLAGRVQELRIPPVEAGLIALADAPAASRATSRLGPWQVQLVADSPHARAGANVLGVDPHARDEFDVLDRGELPLPPGPWVRLSFVNAGWALRPGRYSRDVRGDAGRPQVWQLEVTSQSPGEPVVVRASAAGGIPRDLALRLIDLEQDVAVDLRRGDALAEYALFSHGPRRPYRLALVAGTGEEVDREADALTPVPEAVALNQNSPNPFHPPTRIRFGVPVATTVSVNIYSVRGERVASLLNGEAKAAGYHVVFWDGTDGNRRPLANGVYFCRLETGLRTSRTVKMSLIR